MTFQISDDSSVTDWVRVRVCVVYEGVRGVLGVNVGASSCCCVSVLFLVVFVHSFISVLALIKIFYQLS